MKPFTKLASLLFLFIAVCHVYRLVKQFDVVFGTHKIPLSFSIVSVIVFLVLGITLWRESKK